MSKILKTVPVQRGARVAATALAVAAAGVGVLAAQSALSAGDERSNAAEERSAFTERFREDQGVDVAARKIAIFRNEDARVRDRRERQKIIDRFPPEFAITDVRRVPDQLGLSVYVAAGRTICLSVRNRDRQGSDSCIPATGTEDGKPLVALDRIGARTLVTAVVPSDVRAVTVATENGDRTVPVRAGVAQRVVAEKVTAIKHVDRGGGDTEVRVAPDDG